MNTPTEPAQIEEAFKNTDCEWILDDSATSAADRGKLLIAVAAEIDEFCDEYEKRFAERPDPFDLLAENRDKGAAFFEMFSGPPLSVDMRILIWRILRGLEIRTIELNYDKREKKFAARIVIGTRDGDDEVYRSDHPWDFTLLRHLGMLTIDGRLVLDGYFAMNALGP